MTPQQNPAPPPVTEQLAAFAAGLRWDDLPPDVQTKVAELVTDWVGVTVGGAALASTAAIERGLDDLGVLPGRIRTPGFAGTRSPYAAAFLGASAAHALDFDDTHGPAESHPGAPVIAAALVAAQHAGVDARGFLTGVVAGYEVMTRLSYGLPSTPHADRGFHLTATTGVFGAAAAAANIIGLTAAQTEHAFGTALSRVGGSGQFLETGAWTKRYHTGAASADGLAAALLARAGLTGAARAFEGRCGLFNLYSPEPHPERAVVGIGEVWELLDTSIKPYPCCRASHASIDALAAVLRETGARADDIAAIEVGMARRCIDVVGVPADAKRTPESVVDAQFSAHFALATVAERGRLRYDEYEDAIADPRIRDLMQRIDVAIDDEADAEFPHNFSGRVRVRLHDGRAVEHFARTPSGDPKRPITVDELRDKFDGLVEPVLGAGDARDPAGESRFDRWRHLGTSGGETLDAALDAVVPPVPG